MKTEISVQHIIAEAQEAAAVATKKYLDEIGASPWNCGFAWVNIKPARGPFVKALKDMELGRTDTFYGGYSLWNPSGNPTQDVDAKAAGARAFAAVLEKHGVKIRVCTRMD